MTPGWPNFTENPVNKPRHAMSAIKNITGLIFWVNNTKVDLIEASLKNNRLISKEKNALLKAIQEDQKIKGIRSSSH